MTTMIQLENMARASAANTNFANGDPFVLENFEPFFKDFARTFHNYCMKTNAEAQKLRLSEFYNPGQGTTVFYENRNVKPNDT
jgi:hypothetical protein